MSIMTQTHWPRFQRLFGFFRQLIGIRRTAKMLASSIALSILEFGGFALLFPFIKLATDTAFFERIANKYAGIPGLAFLSDHTHTILIAGVSLVVYFIVKAAAFSMLIKYQADFAADVNAKATQQLIDAALVSRYQLFLDEGAVKIAGIGYTNTTHAALLLQCVIAALNEVIFLAIALSSILFFMPWLLLGLLILASILMFFIFQPLSRKVTRLGHTTRDLDIARHRFIHIMANAIRDIKIMGLEAMFSRRNTEIVSQHVRVHSQYQTISGSIRVLVEALMMIAVVCTCTWLAFSASNILELAPVLATLGLVVARSAPALSRLIGNYNSFRFSLPNVETLMDMCEKIARYPQPKKQLSFNFDSCSYSAKGLFFSYKGKQILKDVSVKIPQGNVVAIVGPSGSGKSTLLDLLAGLQQPSAGNFILNGRSFDPFLNSDFSRHIGYVSQSITLLDATLQFNICLEEVPDTTRLEAAIRKSHLDNLLQTLPQGLQTLIGEGGLGLSGGQRQRVGIARALYRNPALLILDEVTSALDEVTARIVMTEIQELKGQTSILIVTHDLRLIKADTIYQLDQGRLSLCTSQPTRK